MLQGEDDPNVKRMQKMLGSMLDKLETRIEKVSVRMHVLGPYGNVLQGRVKDRRQTGAVGQR
jgi:hypothetical protein